MKFGVCLLNYGVGASKEGIVKVASEAERLGYDSIWTTDHVLPSRADAGPYANLFETFTCLAFAASLTHRVRLGTSVLVLPMRNAIVVAKQVAAIDALSEGRMILGVGAGWMEREFTSLGADFHKRGRILNEGIQILRTLWAEENPEFHGRFASFSDIEFQPKPAQQGGPPIWVGGTSEAAIKRAATLGDAWHPVGSTPQALAAGVEKLRSSSSRRVGVTLRLLVNPEATGPSMYKSASGESRQSLGGPPSTMIRFLERYAAAGLEHLVCYFGDVQIVTYLSRMRIFAENVMPSFS